MFRSGANLWGFLCNRGKIPTSIDGNKYGKEMRFLRSLVSHIKIPNKKMKKTEFEWVHIYISAMQRERPVGVFRFASEMGDEWSDPDEFIRSKSAAFGGFKHAE